MANAATNAIGLDALGALGETANKYDVFTDDGGLKFRAIEESEYCGCTGRVCCRPNHKLQIHVFQEGQEILYFDRGCKCGRCCACTELCQQEMKVYEGPGEGQLIGHIKQPFMVRLSTVVWCLVIVRFAEMRSLSLVALIAVTVMIRSCTC